MGISRIKIGLEISPAICILWALMLLLLPIQWLAACFTAAVFHELCHFAAVKACGGHVSELKIGASGAVLYAEPFSEVQNLLCILAGPVGGLLPLLAAQWLPRVALCAMIYSGYNLLPIQPLDGGNALYSLLTLIIGERKADKITNTVGILSCVLILGTGFIALWMWNLGIWILIPLFNPVWKTAMRKIPCKPGLGRVQ